MKKVKQEGGSTNRVAMFFKRNIYFVLMIVCVLAIGAIITVAAVVNSNDDNVLDPPTVATPGDDDADDDTPTNPDDGDDGDDDDGSDDNKPQKTFTLDGILSEYTVDIGFSNTELVFDPTQKHWATHEGVDLIAEAGEQVKCSFDGTVKSVTTDSFDGTTVVITHDGGFETTYKLLDGVTLKAGDSVAEGDVLGTVSSSALSEIAQGTHIHLELTKDGEKIDPTAYMTGISDK